MEPKNPLLRAFRIRNARRWDDVSATRPRGKAILFPSTLSLLSLLVLGCIGCTTAFPTEKSTRPAVVLPRMRLSSEFSDSDIRGGRLQPLMTINRPLVNIWSSDVPSPFALDYSQEKNTSKLLLESETLRAQAKAIMEQALAMEKDLKESRSKVRTSKLQELDAFIQQWFRSDDINNPGIANVTVVASRLEEQKASQKQVLLVAERIFDLQMEASGQTAFLDQRSLPSNADLVGSDPKYATYQNITMFEYLTDMMEILSRAVALVDERVSNRTETVISARWTGGAYSALQAHLNELRRTQKINLDRKLAADINEMTKMASGSVEEYVRRNLAGPNSTNVVIEEKKMEMIPLWVPAVFLPFIITSKSSSLGPDEVNQLLDDVLMGSRFYVTSHKSVPGAAIFRGNIRGLGMNDGKAESYEQPSALAFEGIQKRLQQTPGLRDRVQLFLMFDPEWRPKQGDDESVAKPVILALSKGISPDQSNTKHGLIVSIGKVLYPLASFTTFRYAIEAYSLNQVIFDAVVKHGSMHVLLKTCLPVCGGILGMQLLQEVVHFLVAKWRRIKIGIPTPIPSVEIGTFGCVTPIRSFPPNRAALLDLALSGPFATTIASIGCILASAVLTVRASPVALMKFPVLPAVAIKSSFLAGTLTSWIASKVLMLPPAQPIPVHPLFLVGYAGLIASGLNLLPVFRLDGGRACSAAMGPKQAAIISVSVILFLLSLALSGGSGLGFSWGMIIALFQRQQEIPPRDDVTEVDNVRLGSWIFSFILAVGILSPFPGAPSIL